MALISPVLRRLETEHLLHCARLIRDCPNDTEDRIQEAQRVLRRTLTDAAVGKISTALRDNVLRILAFAIDTEAIVLCVQPVQLIGQLEATEIHNSVARPS